MFIMKEMDENYFSCSINTESGSDKICFYFTAKDIKGQLTKFPSSFLGDQFTYDLNENRFVDISDQQ